MPRPKGSKNKPKAKEGIRERHKEEEVPHEANSIEEVQTIVVAGDGSAKCGNPKCQHPSLMHYGTKDRWCNQYGCNCQAWSE